MIVRRSKLPTLIGVVLLAAGTALGILLINSRAIFRLGAAGDFEPHDIRTSNVSATSFTVSWTTSKEAAGFIAWGESSSLGKIQKETESDQGFFTHLITLTGLTPSTPYYFKINSGGTSFDNNGIPWQATTLSQPEDGNETVLISGSVLTPSGQPAKRALVYVNVKGELFSTLTSDSGIFVFRLRKFDPETTLLEVSAQAGPAGISSAQIYLKSARPIPPLILGNTHDFKNLPASDSGLIPNSSLNLPEREDQESKFTISNSTPPPSSSQTVTLESVSEGETVTSTQPEFFGSGPSGTTLTIKIESENPITDNINVGNDGSWNWSPPENLAPGPHRITIIWKDLNGVTRSLTRNFIVQAGEAPAFEASTSATTPTPTPSPSPSPKITATPTTPPLPTNVPETGNLTPTFLLSMMGVAVIVFSAFIWKYAQSI